MGALVYSNRGFTDKKAIEKEIEAFVETNGHWKEDAKTVSYHDRRCKNLEEAEGVISKIGTEKWGPAIAVSYYGVPEEVKVTKASKRMKEIEKEDIPELNKRIISALKDLGASFKPSEVELVKCDKCESRVNSAYIRPMTFYDFSNKEVADLPACYCPLCNHKGMSPKSAKQAFKVLAKLRAEMDKLHKEWNQQKEIVASENEKIIFWAVEAALRD